MSDIQTLIHDVRNPLNTISVNAELARLLASRPDSEEKLVKALDRILQECRKCSELLENYQDEND